MSLIPPVNSVSQSPSTSLGIPISYQQPRSKTNPPPGDGRFERPTFTKVKYQGWKKSFVVVEITYSGHVFDKCQVHLNLKEETASVPVIEEMLKEQLGFDIRVLDSKHLPIMAGETKQVSGVLVSLLYKPSLFKFMTSNKFMTLDISLSYPCVLLSGSQFWRSSRKILVAKKSEMANLRK